MSLKKVKSSRQHYLGLGALLLLMALVVAQARAPTSRLRDQTKGLYAHPLTVTRALGKLEVAVTASAMKGNRAEILARGFDGYISKPIDRDALWKTVREFLEREEGDA